MNRNQWLVFGIGMLVLSYVLFTLKAGICPVSDDNIFVGCIVRRYAYAIPAIITNFLGWLFFICAWLEHKKK